MCMHAVMQKLTYNVSSYTNDIKDFHTTRLKFNDEAEKYGCISVENEKVF